jgi:phosphoesterase RecJ-like protein
MNERLRDALSGHVPQRQAGEGLTRAAVLILLRERNDALEVLLTRRSQDVEHHKGQVSFPGGAIEKDETPLHAALRETEEEIGVPASAVEILGGVDEYVTITGFHITPFVGWIGDDVVMKPAKREIHSVFWAPLDHFARRDVRHVFMAPRLGPRFEEVLAFPCGGHIVWGATARMLDNLLRVARDLLPGAALAEVARRLRACRSVVMATHRGPDADGIGSELAIARALESKGVACLIVNHDATPRRFAFLDPEHRIVPAAATGPSVLQGKDLFLVIDTNELREIGLPGEWAAAAGIERLHVDHHRPGLDPDARGVMDPSRSSTGEIALDLIRAMDVAVDTAIAEPLYAAICYDTRSFNYVRNDPRPLRAGAELLACGVDAARVQEHLFMSSRFDQVRLNARTLSRIRVGCNGRLAWADLTGDILEGLDVEPDEMRDAIQYLMAIEGVSVAMTVKPAKEQGKVRLSIRSRHGVSIDGVARALGGGGHAQAAGAETSGPAEAAISRTIALIEPLL